MDELYLAVAVLQLHLPSPPLFHLVMATGGGRDLIEPVGKGSSRGHVKEMYKHTYLLRNKHRASTTMQGSYGDVSRTRGLEIKGASTTPEAMNDDDDTKIYPQGIKPVGHATIFSEYPCQKYL